MLSFIKNSFSNSSGSKLWMVIIGAALGVLLILLGNHTPKKELQNDASPSFDQEELLLYQDYLEERIVSLCQSVSGVGRVTAIVTLEGGFEDVYATQWESGNETYVILGSGSSASALQISRTMPQIAGIGIVCDGGSNAAIRQELTDLLSAAFDLATHRIYVTTRKE
jgi:stage III sporulation protein AG